MTRSGPGGLSPGDDGREKERARAAIPTEVLVCWVADSDEAMLQLLSLVFCPPGKVSRTTIMIFSGGATVFVLVGNKMRKLAVGCVWRSSC